MIRAATLALTALLLGCGPATEVPLDLPACPATDAGDGEDAYMAPEHDAWVAPAPTAARCDFWCQLSSGGAHGAAIGPHSKLQ